MYIVQQQVKPEHKFCAAWVLTKEQLFQFFPEDLGPQIQEGLNNEGIEPIFKINSGDIEYMIRQPTLPLYMKVIEDCETCKSLSDYTSHCFDCHRSNPNYIVR